MFVTFKCLSVAVNVLQVILLSQCMYITERGPEYMQMLFMQNVIHVCYKYLFRFPVLLLYKAKNRIEINTTIQCIYD